MAMKVLYEKESLRLLGAQIVGGDGVDKRIDILATAIRAKMTAAMSISFLASPYPPSLENWNGHALLTFNSHIRS